MNPLVSILIPAYNSEKWIRSALISASSQTWSSKEIIVVDDGSTDNTFIIAKRFESNNIKVFKQYNKGASAARNYALSLAQGEFIQWLDADDILAPDKIQKQLAKSDQSPDSRILHSSAWGIFYHRLKSAKFNSTPLWQDLSPIEWLIIYLSNAQFMANCSWLVSRKLTEMAGLWDERLSLNDDGEYFTRVVCASQLVKFHLESKCYYRKGNPFSLSHSITHSEKAIRSLHLSINLSVNHILKLDNSETARQASIKVLNILLSLIDTSFAEMIELNQKRIRNLGGQIIDVNKTKKYKMIEEVLGTELTNKIKFQFWQKVVLMEKYIDKFKAIILNDEI